MRTEITSELLKVLEYKLTKTGYVIKERPEHEKYGSLKDIYIGDDWVATITSNGLGFPKQPHLIIEQERLVEFSNRFREMYYLHKEATPLPFENLSDYRLVSSFGDTLLAVKQNANNDFVFTTWEYDYDRKGVSMGRYFDSDYEGARRNYLYRAELLEQRKELSQEERTIIYDSLVYRGVNDKNISFDDEQLLRKVTEKIAEDLPSQIIEPREQEREAER